jgi:hypothetical protein
MHVPSSYFVANAPADVALVVHMIFVAFTAPAGRRWTTVASSLTISRVGSFLRV